MLKMKEMPYYNLQQSFLQGKLSLTTVQFLLKTKLNSVNNENKNKPNAAFCLTSYHWILHC